MKNQGLDQIPGQRRGLCLFAALAVPDEIAQGLARRQAGLEGARWRTAEQLHVTLRFFGEVREDVARDLDAELSTLGGGPFKIVLEGAAPSARAATSMRSGPAWPRTPSCRGLARACETAPGARA